MTVYVDELRQYPRPKGAKSTYSGKGEWWCHMMADTTQELIDMARELNLSMSWIQLPGKPLEHFDLTPAKRSLALSHGAKPMPSTFALRKVARLHAEKVKENQQ